MTTASEILKNLSSAAAQIQPPAAGANVPTLQESASIDTTKRVFKSDSASMQMCSDAGTRIVFVRGKFITDDPEIIQYLDTQINKYKVPGLFVDKGEMYYDVNIHDPIASLRNKIRQEVIAEAMFLAQQASGNLSRDLGSSEQGRLNTANTTSIAAVAAGSGPRG